MAILPAAAAASSTDRDAKLAHLRALEQRVLWLAVWMIHHANHLRPKRDGLKVGGHQASSASVATLMTALYFDVLRPEDRVAVKPHASPVFHAIQYLFGRQSRARLEQFRAYGGAQAYPSRTKDADDVDFSTGSVGLGVAMTSFAALTRDYLRLKGLLGAPLSSGRMIAVAGDAEFDEGNIFEALLESMKHDVRSVWWIIDYNRQSLDAVIADRFFHRLDHTFRGMDWRVVTLKYGRLLERAFTRRGGDALRDWIDRCPNSRYSALAYKGGAAWREQVARDLGTTSGIKELLDEHDDDGLQALMTNLGGHDLESILDAFHGIDDDQPTSFIAYTIKGYGLPFAGHKDNHAGMMTAEQVQTLQRKLRVGDGDEWEPLAGVDNPGELTDFIHSCPFAAQATRRLSAVTVAVPKTLEPPMSDSMSTQLGFGRLLADIAREHPELAGRIVTTSPDVTVSTNLGGWVNRRAIFDARERADTFRDEHIVSAQNWAMSPQGQHIELGIAESNFFLMLAALGLSAPLFGQRLLPIGTVYDPFIGRGLDSLNYACYQDARFILVGTPSGVSLAPEGGAHQSVITPLIGISQPGLTAYEPAYVDELSEMLRWSFDHLQADNGGSVYLRLSTRPLSQPNRTMTSALREGILAGGYWLIEPDFDAELAIVACGAVVAEAIEAHRQIAEDVPGAGLMVVTSPDRLQKEWRDSMRTGAAAPHVSELLAAIPAHAGLVSVVDGHPATLAWLGSVRRQRIVPLGVDRFGQSGDIPDIYHAYGIDADAIVAAAAYLWK
ncbi:MAG TPA: 1-deoxy-D-xylulose-5-phosphate synthase N-terminal domain-containing protein [Vicinamibacterales bacterium]|jgi:pyruvate dehydrogenase E1 component|nr:1-deoxy-D-xylulose-5-phosphate synthase N-terminal domain-containing protein [Vicinamibacterales bacterium]